jgi:hypothetical protein
MSQDQQSRSQQLESSNGRPWVTGGISPDTKSDDWSNVEDLAKRRKIQNKLAQRRYREWKILGER